MYTNLNAIKEMLKDRQDAYPTGDDIVVIFTWFRAAWSNLKPLDYNE
jgi:hypothetical protein